MHMPTGVVNLPEPARPGKMPVESALFGRISTREFKEISLSIMEISQLVWAALGVNRPNGYRTCPSAGALFPLEIHLAAGSVDGLSPGIYRYDPLNHRLLLSNERDLRRELTDAALGQSMIARAPVTIVITAVPDRTTRKYGERGMRYVFMEAGHAAQSIHLQAVSLGLGTVVVGAFRDDAVKQILGLEVDEIPLLMMPAGHRLRE